MQKRSLEGIVAKRRDSAYLPGKRVDTSLKVSTRKQQEFVIGGSSQSAFVIAVSALEVGAKYFISRRVPESEWLMSNIASPDLVKILGDYFKILDGSFVLEADKIEEVRKIIGNRNTMVHSGKMSFDDQRIVDAVKFIERLLGKIDNHLGYN